MFPAEDLPRCPCLQRSLFAQGRAEAGWAGLGGGGRVEGLVKPGEPSWWRGEPGPPHSSRCHSPTPSCLPCIRPPAPSCPRMHLTLTPPQGLCTAAPALFSGTVPPSGTQELFRGDLNPSSTSREAACLTFPVDKTKTVLRPSTEDGCEHEPTHTWRAPKRVPGRRWWECRSLLPGTGGADHSPPRGGFVP